MEAGKEPEDLHARRPTATRLTRARRPRSLGPQVKASGEQGPGLKVVLTAFRRILLALCALGLGAWAAAALLEAGSDAGPWRQLLAVAMAAVAIASAAVVLLRGPGRRALALMVVPAFAVVGWYAALQPRNDRDWLPDVAQAPWAEVAEDRITLHNVRNFAWRTEADFTPRWETRTVDLAQLEGVDLVASYWMGDASPMSW